MLCSSHADRQTDRHESEYRGHPFRVSGFFKFSFNLSSRSGPIRKGNNSSIRILAFKYYNPINNTKTNYIRNIVVLIRTQNVCTEALATIWNFVTSYYYVITMESRYTCAILAMVICTIRVMVICAIRVMVICAIRVMVICAIRVMVICAIRVIVICAIRVIVICAIRDVTMQTVILNILH